MFLRFGETSQFLVFKHLRTIFNVATCWVDDVTKNDDDDDDDDDDDVDDNVTQNGSEIGF